MSGVPSDKVTSGSFVNPKVGASCDPVDSWYRYYAGYSAGFVEQHGFAVLGVAGFTLDRVKVPTFTATFPTWVPPREPTP